MKPAIRIGMLFSLAAGFCLADTWTGRLIDAACFDQATGPQFTPMFSGHNGTGTETDIPLGNFQISGATFSNFDDLTTAIDYTISSKDSRSCEPRKRYLS